ncbi:M28 family metallopeptidase [Winogradskyella aurantiaca]|uniref:M28 family metallopeptidase n=1 Tax=Winogradskyella aurantiaca TaxID=2219558 RepID=UPI000E1DB069|nr:M28 family metallopeptidase [Winogradskyella aurantiaca]
MKSFFASFLFLVGSCATLRHSEKVEKLRNSIQFSDRELVSQYMATISQEELKEFVYQVASDKYMGRMTGQPGHDSLCNYLINYYKTLEYQSPKGYPDYKQIVPKEALPPGVNSSLNVIAFIEGSEYPNEYVYITGHSDHEGVVEGLIYPGADDNGSGTAALMEIAEAFKMAENNGHGPKRSLVFLHVTAEEIGLYGSKYYSENPIFPIEQTTTVLNTDMIGRVDPKHQENENYIYLIGSDRLSTELDFIAQEANETFTNLELDYTFNDPKDPNSYFFRSDHYNFADKGVPVIFFFNGEHEDYTKPTDTPEKVNYPLLKKRTDLIFATAWYLVNAEQPVTKEVL